jgi:hypothetical protein
MKTTGEAVGRQLKALVAACAVVGLTSQALAQDVTITSFDQLAQVALSANYSIYMPFSPWDWRAYPTDWPLWYDSTSLSCLNSLPTSTNFMTSMDWSNVPLASVILTKAVLSGVVTVSADGTNEIATIPAPGGYQPGVGSEDRWVWDYYVQATNNADAWGLTPGQIPPPAITLRTYLANSNAHYSVYESNIEAEVAAEAAAATAACGAVQPSGSLALHAMDAGDPCTITNDADSFQIVSATVSPGGFNVVFQSCSDHAYLIASSDALSATTAWSYVASIVPGQDGTTSWTDPSTVNTNITARFYRVDRWWLGDSVGDGIPDWWRQFYFGNGTTTNDLSCATCDPTGDGYDNYMKYLTGGNPNEAYLDIVVNNGNSYTTSQVIPIDPLSTNFPDILISTDPFMSNAVLYANNGSIEYTLANTSNPQSLYLQYAGGPSAGQGPILTKVVTLDTVPPVVMITSPASNAVLNQAFITLQAVAYDPDPLWTDDGRPLQIWINGQPYYDRSGTNIYIERFPVPVGTNSFTVTILAANQAGITNQATQTWAVNTGSATNAPDLLTVNLSSPMLLPNVSSIWVEGTVDNAYALVNAIVTSLVTGDVSTNSLAVRQNQYEGLVPLESGTNQLVLVASDAAGHATSEAFTLISSTEFSAAITNPVFDAYATAPSNHVSGYVSTLFDAGLPTQTNVVGVLINGVAAVVNWNNPDGNGNVPFTTTNMIPSGTPITGQVLIAGGSSEFEPMGGGGGPSGPPVTIPPAQSQTYEVLHWESHDDAIQALPGAYAVRPAINGDTCQLVCASSDWWAMSVRAMVDDVVDIGDGEQYAEVESEVANRCVSDPNPETFSWTPYQSSQSSCAGTNGGSGANCSANLPRSMSFGRANADGGLSYEGFCYCWGWYCSHAAQNLQAYRDRRRGTLTFRAPRSYDTNTTVIFTFEGVDYRPFWDTTTNQPLGPLDLSQVTYRGLRPYAYSNEAQTVSYLISVTRGKEYTINEDSFGWPSGAVPQAMNCPDGSFVALDSYHWLSWTNLHNAYPQIIGPSNLVSTANAAGSNVTLTATNFPPGGTFEWTKNSGNIEFTGSTTGPSVVVTPVQGRFTPSGAVEVVTLTYASSGGTTTKTLNMIVQHPTSLSTISEDSITKSGRLELDVRYQILDQNGQPLRCVVAVGSTQVRIATLKASEIVTWQCNTFCSGAQGDSKDVGVADDGTFGDSQAAPNTCNWYVRSQGIYVGIQNYSSQDTVAHKCICFDGDNFRILDGTADGTACCNTCGH